MKDLEVIHTRKARRIRAGISTTRPRLPNRSANSKSNHKWLGQIASYLGRNILAIFALVVSVLSFSYSQQTQRNTAQVEAFKRSFDDVYAVQKLEVEHPYLSHLFAAADYDAVSKDLKSATMQQTAKERAKLLLQERAMADNIFALYEHAFGQWMMAEAQREQGRAAILRSTTNYYAIQIRENPRLWWYWSSTALKSSVGSEASRNLDNAPVPTAEPDPMGPFAPIPK